eukprot:8400755-Pyramimonas_sp.AAC.1
MNSRTSKPKVAHDVGPPYGTFREEEQDDRQFDDIRPIALTCDGAHRDVKGHVINPFLRILFGLVKDLRPEARLYARGTALAIGSHSPNERCVE